MWGGAGEPTGPCPPPPPLHSPNSVRWSGGNCRTAPPPPTRRQEERAPDPVFSPLPGREGGRRESFSACRPGVGPVRLGEGRSPCGRCLQPLVPPGPPGDPKPELRRPTLARQVLFPAALWAPPPQRWVGRVRRGRGRKAVHESILTPNISRGHLSPSMRGRRRAMQTSGRRTAPTLSSGKFQEGRF